MKVREEGKEDEGEQDEEEKGQFKECKGGGGGLGIASTRGETHQSLP